MLAAVLVTASSAASGRGPDVTCRRVGDDGRQLVIRAQDVSNAYIAPAGERIVVDDGDPLTCAGGEPTVHNTDLIQISGNTGPRTALRVPPIPKDPWLYLDTGRGGLGPGATSERSGRSEIEITVTGRFYGTVLRFSGRSDFVTFGTTKGRSGANLNAREPSPDTDLVFLRRDTELPGVSAGRGADRIDASGAGPAHERPLRRPAAIEGGGGPDELIGGPVGTISAGITVPTTWTADGVRTTWWVSRAPTF